MFIKWASDLLIQDRNILRSQFNRIDSMTDMSHQLIWSVYLFTNYILLKISHRNIHFNLSDWQFPWLNRFCPVKSEGALFRICLGCITKSLAWNGLEFSMLIPVSHNTNSVKSGINTDNCNLACVCVVYMQLRHVSHYCIMELAPALDLG